MNVTNNFWFYLTRTHLDEFTAYFENIKYDEAVVKI
jgi:hypothetical protein